MFEPRIKIQHVWKQYKLGSSVNQGGTFRELLMDKLKPRGEVATREQDAFWALQDVSLDINAGEVVGIVGRNGSGKSTLLKVLGRITPPTRGEIEIRGRVASLLEVGTGFHPELTGRENVFLNGAILGMSRAEIQRKFDDIVAFSGTERFLDTPLKRYSSGMQVRLAFAVAAHLDTDILLVDEVLAVGDAEFQRRCLGKMTEIVQDGRTVLFVSHDVNAVRRLCPKSLWLDGGNVRGFGDTNDVMNAYLGGDSDHNNRIELGKGRHSPDGTALSLTLSGPDSVPGRQFVSGDAITSTLRFKLSKSIPRFSAMVSLVSSGSHVVRSYHSPTRDLEAGTFEFTFDITDEFASDEFRFHVYLLSGGIFFYAETSVPGFSLMDAPDSLRSIEPATVLTPSETGGIRRLDDSIVESAA